MNRKKMTKIEQKIPFTGPWKSNYQTKMTSSWIYTNGRQQTQRKNDRL